MRVDTHEMEDKLSANIVAMDEVEGYETNGLSCSTLQRSLVAIIYPADI